MLLLNVLLNALINKNGIRINLLIFFGLLVALPVNSQPISLLSSINLSFPSSSASTKLNFKPPSRGAPGDRKDAGSRFPNDLSFIPIIPKNNLGLTISSHPTFWVYISPNFNCRRLGFTLLENGGKTHQIFYNMDIDMSGKKGLINIALPDDSPPLKQGESYRWIFSCGVDARYGEIERIELTPQLIEQLDQVNPREKIGILATQGIWYETITLLINLHSQYPQDMAIQSDLQTLLQDPSVELNELEILLP